LFGASIGRGASRIISAMVQGLARRRINPNLLTVTGVSINVLCGLMFALGHFFWAGLILIVANLFDMLDGQVARLTNQVTRFGGFLDSTLDRVSDMAAFVGLMLFYARDTEFHSTLNVLLAGLAMVGSVLGSYASARAESLIPKCDVGFLRRPERVVLLIIGALSTHPSSNSIFANRMPAVLWILAVGSFWTFAFRVYHTWSELNRLAPTTSESATTQVVSETPQTRDATARRADDAGAPTPPDEASNTDASRLDAPDISRRVPASR
jgi:CDP-diacylglycerol--glycerol-3-phosphate 3-phosphatidyltransferase